MPGDQDDIACRKGMNMGEQRVLGVDPGLNVTGYGVIRFHPAGELSVVEAGVLRGGDARRPLGARLIALRDGLADVIDTLKPDVVAMEELYSHYERPRTAILMGHARGVLCLAAADHQRTVHHYSATRIKRVLTGNGRATKSQIQRAITALLGLPEVPEPPDVADALAIAACHYFLHGKQSASPLSQTG